MVRRVWRELVFAVSLAVAVLACLVVEPGVTVPWRTSETFASDATAVPSATPCPAPTPVPTRTSGVVLPTPPPTTTLFPDEPLPLSSFPRPAGDNGLGVHWSTHLYAQSDAATSYFVSELVRMNIKWVKLLNDGVKGREYDDTID